MNEGLIIDVINFGINNKTIFIFSKESILEKYFIYPAKNSFNYLSKYDKLDYITLIKYEFQKKGNRFDFEIIDSFLNLKKNYKKIIISAIFSDLLKNCLAEGESSSIDYNNIQLFLNFLNLENKNLIDIEKDLKENISVLILFLYYLISNSGIIDFSSVNQRKISDNSLLFFDRFNNHFVVKNNSENKNPYYLKSPKELFYLLDFKLQNFKDIQNIIDKFIDFEIKNLNNLLFFLSNLYKFSYHRKNIKSLEFLKYLE